MLRKFGYVLALLALGAVELVTAVTTLLCLVLTVGLGLVFLFPPQVRMIRWVTGVTRRLVSRCTDVRIDPPYRPKPPPPRPQADGLYRSHRTLYKTPRIPAWNDRWKWLFGDPATWRDGFWLLVDPLVKVTLLPLLVLLPGRGLRVYALWCVVLLGTTASSRRADQLNQARNLAVDTQAAEMRRLERDLHDGTQARLVALGMTIGAAEQLMESDPPAARALMVKAREASAATLTELRRVIRGIHPPVLAERGLGDAVRALAVDSPLRVSVEVDLPHRADAPVEVATYFAISELLANATRHGEAESVRIDISSHGPSMRVTVTDDGLGGADPARGSGLAGIERRLATFDGVLAIHSPPGGPTMITIELPRALPEHWAGEMSRLPRWKAVTVALLLGTAWCPLFPQGIVAGIFNVFDVNDHSWLLALYLPEQWQWPFTTVMILLGTAMYVAAAAIWVGHRWNDGLPATTPLGAMCPR